MKALSPVGTVVSPLPEQSAPPSSSQLHEGEQTAVDCPWPVAPGRRKHHKHIQNKSTRIFPLLGSDVSDKGEPGGLIMRLNLFRTSSSHVVGRLRHEEIKPNRRFFVTKFHFIRASPQRNINANVLLMLKNKHYLPRGACYLTVKHFSTLVCRISP